MARQDRIGTVATTVHTENGIVSVTYHNTIVVEWDTNNKTVTLNSGGWRTVTTKTRMNQAANQYNLGFAVYQEKGDWFVQVGGWENGQTLPFEDHMAFAV